MANISWGDEAENINFWESPFENEKEKEE
jgi:hypothetical protein